MNRKTRFRILSPVAYIPAEALRPYVKAIVISRSDQAGSYKVLPDTAIVMGFQFSGRLSSESNGNRHPLSNAGITGLSDAYKLFVNSAHTSSVLVYFSETGAAAFFPQPMNELFGRSLALDDLVMAAQMDVITEQVHLAINDAGRVAAVEKFLLERLNPQGRDELVDLAVALIRQAKGTIKIAALAQKLNISQSRFEKRFRKIVGASPKKFASIIRLRQVLSQVEKGDNFTAGALDAGYFDQAHFIKDFKSFTGQTPEQFFKET